VKRDIVNVLAAALLVAPLASFGGFGDIVSSFPCEGNITQLGLAWDGSYLDMTNNHASGDHLWRRYNTAGSWLSSFQPPVTSAQYGAAFDGTYFWGGSQTTDYLYRFTGAGSAVSSFSAANPYGIAWDGSYIWWLSSTGDVFRRCTTTGSVVSSFTVAAIADGRDLGWDGSSLWCPDSTDDVVYQFTTAGSVLASFAAPGGLTYGCAYDGTYLWLTDIGTPRYAYRIDIRISAVAPASFGKIRALYH
jgi:hypothetical protein